MLGGIPFASAPFASEQKSVASGATAYTLSCAAGSYAISGQAATLTAGRKVAGAAGSYALTGQAATLTAARGLLGGAGSYVLAGQDVTITVGSASTGAPDYGTTPKRKKKGRYVAEVGGKLVVFTSAAEALAASQDDDEPQAVEAARSPRKPSPLFSVSLDDVRALASEREALAVFQRQLERMQYDALLRSYEKWQREQDEQDIEELLLLI